MFIQKCNQNGFVVVDDNRTAPSMWDQYYMVWTYDPETETFFQKSRGPAPEACFEKNITPERFFQTGYLTEASRKRIKAAFENYLANFSPFLD